MNESRKGSDNNSGTVAAVTIVLLLASSTGVAYAIRRKQQQQQHVHDLQHLQNLPVAVAVNFTYTIDAEMAGSIKRHSVVVTDFNQRQFSIPMEETPGDGLPEDPSAPGEYLVPMTHNGEFTYAPPMLLPTPQQGTSTAAAATASTIAEDYSEIDDPAAAAIARDGDGYVVDEFSPSQSAGGDSVVYATYGTRVRNNLGAAAATEYAVPTSDGDTIAVYAPAPITESNV